MARAQRTSFSGKGPAPPIPTVPRGQQYQYNFNADADRPGGPTDISPPRPAPRQFAPSSTVTSIGTAGSSTATTSTPIFNSQEILDNTSRVVVNTQQPVALEPVYQTKGHNTVIKVSYPVPEPNVTFPNELHEDHGPVPPARRSQQQQQPVPQPMARTLMADTQMGLDNFKLCTVLGRGHFGKVRCLIAEEMWRSTSFVFNVAGHIGEIC
jgi:hypothetical protein